jgi:hypothetical protein
MPTFEQIFSNRVRATKLQPPPDRLVSFDPGSTTGTASFHGLVLHKAVQLNTSRMDIALEQYTMWFDEQQPTEVVMEDYRVYANKIQQHANSSLETPRLIGMIETLCFQRKVPFHKQPAGTTKQFCTDEKLKTWGMYLRGQQHARDAVRHAAYYILFPPKVRTSEHLKSTSEKAGRHVG